MAVNKNQLAGQRGGAARNEMFNGGIHDCCKKYNAANVGSHWRSSKKWERKFWTQSIKRKKNKGGL